MEIIRHLQADGRRAYAAIGAEVGLSEAAVRQRVRGLVRDGVIQIVAVPDPFRLGLEATAMLGLSVEGDLMRVAQALAGIPEVDYVVLTAGSFDMLVEVMCRNHDHLLELLNDKVRSLPGVTRAETFTYLRVFKQTYTYGAR